MLQYKLVPEHISLVVIHTFNLGLHVFEEGIKQADGGYYEKEGK